MRTLALRTVAVAVVLFSLNGGALAEPTPVVESIEPTAGPPGSEVDILGRYFPASAQLRIGTHALEVVKRRPGRWTVRVPAGATTGRVLLITAKSEYAGPTFRVTAGGPAPVIHRVEPSEAEPGAEIVIEGANFGARLPDNQVRVGAQAMVVRSATPTTLHVIVPSGASTGPLHVSVDNAGTATFDGFRVAAPIAVLGFEPALTSPGATVVIRGTGFAADAARNRVYLNSLRLSVTKASPTELTVSLPARATTGAVLVDVVRGGRAQSTSELRVEEPPVITAVDPDGAIPGASITLRGKHFGDDLREVHVRLGEQELKVRTVAPTEIVADIPQGAVSGVLEVQVATLAPARALRPFEVRVPVTVGVFHPTSGPAGTRVALQGGGFSKAAAQNRVVLGSTPVRVVTANAQQLILEIPERAMTGVLKVAVPGAGSASTAQPFVVTVPPILGAFDPVEGPPGTDVTLRGAHFGTNPALVEVTLSGTKLEIAKLTDGIIVVRVPDAAQTGKFSVRVAAQGSVVSGAAFRVTAPPAAGLNLTSIEPVCQKAGCEVALKGTGFAAKAENNHVFFGSTELKVTSATANVLKVRLPELLGSDVFRVAVDDAGEVSSAPFEIVK